MFYADLHIHSKYSRATSKDCDLEHLALWGAKKGLSVISTGDFTHPTWFFEIQEKLNYIGNGLFELKDEKALFQDYPNLCAPKFLLSVEISTIYKKNDKTRKVHHVVFCPDIEAASKFRNKLDSIGNIKSDGRPILGLDSRNLLEIALESSSDSYIIPAHIWTPWFSVLGSKSGFDSIEECYEDLSEHIFALETGLSSDPYMNWHVSKLDRFRLVSNSDAHSPSKLAREATVFSEFPDYYFIKNALKTGIGYIGTVEFFPEEGKYHLDGHRKCGVCLESSETKRLQGICPVCHKPLTVGVSYRVEELADRFGSFEPPKTAGKVFSLVPLNEIIAETLNVGASSKKVQIEYERLINKFGSELSILQDIDLNLLENDSPVLKEAISRLRREEVIKKGGFDGEYGVIKLFKEGEVESFLNLKLGLNLIEVPKAKKKEYKKVEIKKEVVETKKEFSADSAQLEAISDKSSKILVLAGPGAGKTTVLTKRIARLILEDKVRAGDILAITFTKKAALEMKQRLSKLNCVGVNIHTFHSLCYQILKENLDYDFSIVTNEERALYTEEELPQNPLSFDDLINLTLAKSEILKKYQYKYLFIDEYQDIDKNQYELIKALKSENIFAIGDANQAIYSFRGGSSKYFKSFDLDYPDSKTINLKNNYRSNKTIVQASNQLINSFNIVSKSSLEDKIVLHKAPSESAEAEFIVSSIEKLIGGQGFFSYDSNRAQGNEEDNFSFSDFAILYRTKSQLKALEEALNRISMPYANYSDELLCNKKEIRKFLMNLSDKPLEYEINLLNGKVETSVIEYFLKLAKKVSSKTEFIHEVSFLTLADTYDKRADRISLMTLHASKGLEFKCVFIAGVEEGILPFSLCETKEEIEEEKRLLYVGMTRAKEKLLLSYSKKRNIKGGFQERSKSRFLAPIDKELFSLSEFKSNYKKEEAKQLSLF